MLSSCFFLIGIGFICKKNFKKTFKESFKDQRWAWEESVRAEKRDKDAERERKETFRRQRHHQSDRSWAVCVHLVVGHGICVWCEVHFGGVVWGAFCQEDIPETSWKNTKAFLRSIKIFDNSSFHTFPGISQNLPENVSIFSLKWKTYVCSLRKTKH